jgi:hypothetical protein
MKQLQVLGRGGPAVTQERARGEVLKGARVAEQLRKMVVLGLALSVRGIPPIITRRAVPLLPGPRPQVYHPVPFAPARLLAAVLGPHQFKETGIPVVLPAILPHPKGFFTLLDAVLP